MSDWGLTWQKIVNRHQVNIRQYLHAQDLHRLDFLLKPNAAPLILLSKNFPIMDAKKRVNWRKWSKLQFKYSWDSLSFSSNWRQRGIMLLRCRFWQLPPTVTSLCPKSPRCSWEPQATPNIIGRLKEDVERLDGTQSDIIRVCWIETLLLCLLWINPNTVSLQSREDYTV